MTTEVMGTEWCASCDECKPLDDLLEVVDVRSGARHFVCRPGGLSRGSCFRRAVGRASIHRISRPDR